jgi:hypothetical protein
MITLKAPAKAQSLSPFCHQYACPLGSPWHYRRAGVYYLRLRPKGQTEPSTSLSLRTTVIRYRAGGWLFNHPAHHQGMSPGNTLGRPT